MATDHQRKENEKKVTLSLRTPLPVVAIPMRAIILPHWQRKPLPPFIAAASWRRTASKAGRYGIFCLFTSRLIWSVIVKKEKMLILCQLAWGGSLFLEQSPHHTWNILSSNLAIFFANIFAKIVFLEMQVVNVQIPKHMISDCRNVFKCFQV